MQSHKLLLFREINRIFFWLNYHIKLCYQIGICFKHQNTALCFKTEEKVHSCLMRKYFHSTFCFPNWPYQHESWDVQILLHSNYDNLGCYVCIERLRALLWTSCVLLCISSAHITHTHTHSHLYIGLCISWMHYITTRWDYYYCVWMVWCVAHWGHKMMLSRGEEQKLHCGGLSVWPASWRTLARVQHKHLLVQRPVLCFEIRLGACFSDKNDE